MGQTLRIIFLVVISVLASFPAGIIVHEGWHWISGYFSDYRTPRYVCFNPQAFSDPQSERGLFFVRFDLDKMKDKPTIKVEDYTTVSELKTEEMIAMILMILVMMTLSFVILKKLDGDVKRKK